MWAGYARDPGQSATAEYLDPTGYAWDDRGRYSGDENSDVKLQNVGADSTAHDGRRKSDTTRSGHTPTGGHTRAFSRRPTQSSPRRELPTQRSTRRSRSVN
jgi:hypothetical protein